MDNLNDIKKIKNLIPYDPNFFDTNYPNYDVELTPNIYRFCVASNEAFDYIKKSLNYFNTFDERFYYLTLIEQDINEEISIIEESYAFDITYRAIPNYQRKDINSLIRGYSFANHNELKEMIEKLTLQEEERYEKAIKIQEQRIRAFYDRIKEPLMGN